jgi:ribosome-binding protein aMBF1 (putative translation factor)
MTPSNPSQPEVAVSAASGDEAVTKKIATPVTRSLANSAVGSANGATSGSGSSQALDEHAGRNDSASSSAVNVNGSSSVATSLPTSTPTAPSETTTSVAKASEEGKRNGGAIEGAAKVSANRAKKSTKATAPSIPNNVRKLREDAMMSKAELARRAGVSPLTIDRVEAGMPCRMDTKRKILEALGLSPSARTQVWPESFETENLDGDE